jgi:hypothetical protein
MIAFPENSIDQLIERLQYMKLAGCNHCGVIWDMDESVVFPIVLEMVCVDDAGIIVGDSDSRKPGEFLLAAINRW